LLWAAPVRTGHLESEDSSSVLLPSASASTHRWRPDLRSSASIPTQRAVAWFTGAGVTDRLNRGSALDTARRHAGPARM